MRRKQFAVWACSMIVGAGLLVGGCQKEEDKAPTPPATPTTPKPAPTAGTDASKAADTAAKKVEEGAAKVQEGAEKGADAAANAADSAAKTSADAAKKAGDGASAALSAVDKEANTLIEKAQAFIKDKKLSDAEPIVKKLEEMKPKVSPQIASAIDTLRSSYDAAKKGAEALQAVPGMGK